MGFADEINAFAAKAVARVDTAEDQIADEMFRSIVEGSEITGAPGQPVAPSGDENSGKLRDSWKKEREADGVTLMSTDVDYAQNVEDNVREVHFSNHGPHSVKRTAAGFPRIVDIVTERVAHD